MGGRDRRGYARLGAGLSDLLDAIQSCCYRPITAAQLEALSDGLRTLRDALRRGAARTPSPHWCDRRYREGLQDGRMTIYNPCPERAASSRT